MDNDDFNSQFFQIFGASLAEVLALPWQRKRVFTPAQFLVLLRMQLRGCAPRTREHLVLAHLVSLIDAAPSLTRSEIKSAYEHLENTPGLPLLDDAGALFPLQDWLYGCPNAVLKALMPDEAAELDRVVPPERHLILGLP